MLEIVERGSEYARDPDRRAHDLKAEEDVLRSCDLHANAYVTKPVGFESFMSVIQQVDEFFLSVVRLPPAVNVKGCSIGPGPVPDALVERAWYRSIHSSTTAHSVVSQAFRSASVSGDLAAGETGWYSRLSG